MNTIKIGSMDFDAIKVGDGDVDKIYAGDTLIYQSTPPTLQWVTYQGYNSVPDNKQFYGIRYNVNTLTYTEPASLNFSNGTDEINLIFWNNIIFLEYDSQHTSNSPDADGYVTYIFSDYLSGNFYKSSGFDYTNYTFDLLQY